MKKLKVQKVNMYIFFHKIVKFDCTYTTNQMNPKIISSLRNRSKFTKRYNFNSTEEIQNLTTKSNECSNNILKSKERQIIKLTERSYFPSTMLKAYWSILYTFLKTKKMPNIPPLNESSEIISNFDKKAKFLNLHSAPQCSPINNSSVHGMKRCLRSLHSDQVPLQFRSPSNSGSQGPHFWLLNIPYDPVKQF